MYRTFGASLVFTRTGVLQRQADDQSTKLWLVVYMFEPDIDVVVLPRYAAPDCPFAGTERERGRGVFSWPREVL